VLVDGDQFLGEQNGGSVLLETLAVALALDFLSAVEHRFDRAELLNELD